MYHKSSEKEEYQIICMFQNYAIVIIKSSYIFLKIQIKQDFIFRLLRLEYII